jgi:serine/threonine-protein kinase RsbW
MAAFKQDLNVTNQLSCLAQVRAAVKQGIEQAGFPAQYTNRLQIAVDEAVSNIIQHGYAGVAAGSAKISVRLNIDKDCFRVDVEDEGEHFDPQHLDDIDIRQHVAAGRSGGLGVFLMRRILDKVEYHYEGGKRNYLTLTKYR